MTRRWPDLPWSLLLAASAGAALVVAADDGGRWALAPLGALAAVLAGRRLASLRAALVVLTASVTAGLGTALSGGSVAPWSEALTVLLLIGALTVLPWWAGRTRRLRAEHAVRERAVVAEQARLRERARIAADMHDSLGHELALIALRSGALELDPTATEAQQAAAAALRVSATTATQRLHDILGLLREDTDLPSSATGTVDDVKQLIAGARAAGAHVHLHRTTAHGTGDATPTAREAVHRVVREALTNAAKHAPGSPVTVHLNDSADDLLVTVSNPLPAEATAALGSGRGLAALQERLHTIGGALTAGRQEASFTVRAQVPREATDDHGGHNTADPQPALRDLRRHRHNTLARTTALPLLLATVLLVALVSVQAVTVHQTALHPDAYAQLQVGQTRQQIAPLLPPGSQDAPPPIIDVPPAPAETSCQFFQARAHALDLSQDMYRLCFRDDVLVAKDPLLPGPA